MAITGQRPARRTRPLSVRDVRRSNSHAVLMTLWGADSVTATALMEATDLTRATVHDVCVELLGRGWIVELPNQRLHGGYTKGRPARRYALNHGAGIVVGVDAGQHRATAIVADLRGDTLARWTVTMPQALEAADERLAAITLAVDTALTRAGRPPEQVLMVAVGLPAPVREDGHPAVTGNPFWDAMTPDIAGHLAHRHGWECCFDNDANLAALAEGWLGRGRGARSHVTLLSGERLGGGVVVDGGLLRGSRHGIGEMAWLDFVGDVGNADGIAPTARMAALDALAAHPGTPSGLRDIAYDDLTSQVVFSAAEAGDPLAAVVMDQVGVWLARVAYLVAKVYDTDLVIVGGAVAAACSTLLGNVEQALSAAYAPPIPRVVTSELGDAGVALGAVRMSLDRLRDHALDIELPERARISG